MIDYGVSPAVLFAVAIGVLTAAGGFALGVKFRYLNPQLPQYLALAGLLIGLICAPSIAVAFVLIVTTTVCYQLYRAKRLVHDKIDRYVDRVAIETGKQHNQRPLASLMQEAEQEHQERIAAICSADHPTKSRRQLLQLENNRHKQVVSRLASGDTSHVASHSNR